MYFKYLRNSEGSFSLGGSSKSEDTTKEESSTSATDTTNTIERQPSNLDVYGASYIDPQIANIDTATATNADLSNQYSDVISQISGLTDEYKNTFDYYSSKALKELDPTLNLAGASDSALGVKIKSDALQGMVNDFLTSSMAFSEQQITDTLTALNAQVDLSTLDINTAMSLINAVLGQTQTYATTGTSSTTSTAGVSASDTDTDQLNVGFSGATS